MFNVRIKVSSSFGNNVTSSNVVKRVKFIEEVYRTKSDFIIVEQYVKKMHDQAKKTVVVRTGNLRASIAMRETSKGFVFFVDDQRAPYGIYIEKGARSMPPRPFFLPAITAHRDPLRKAYINFYRQRR